jgi:hypothetical protein
MSGRPFLLWHKKKPACGVLPPVVDFFQGKNLRPLGRAAARRAAAGVPG